MLRRNNALSFATFHTYDCLCVVGGEFKRDVDWEYFCKTEGKLMKGLPATSGGKELKKLLSVWTTWGFSNF